MENQHKNTATLIHLSSLVQYCIPLSNFILPIVIWSINKHKSAYVDAQGKQVINFQLSVFLYTFILALIAIPIFLITFLSNATGSASFNCDNFEIHNFDFNNHSGMIMTGIFTLMLFGFMKIAEFFLIIYAALKTSNGDDFKYPATIQFIK
jgi:uncharacterized Tic20 family protein